LINLCLTPTLAVFQLYRGVIIIIYLFYLFLLWKKVCTLKIS